MARKRTSGAGKPANDRTGILFLIAISIIPAVLAYILLTYGQPEPLTFQTRWIRCIDRFADGSIYGGQPECEQTPIIFLVGWILSAISQSNLQLLSNLTLIALNAASIYLIIGIVNTRNRTVMAVISVFYCLSVVPNTLEDLPSLISGVFGLLAVKTFLGSEEPRELLKTSGYLILSLSSKVMALSLIAGILSIITFHGVRRALASGGRKDFNIQPLIESAKKCAYISIPIAVSILLAVLAYPLIILYTMTSHSMAFPASTADAIWLTLKTNPLEDARVLMFYALMIASAVYYRKSGDSLAIAFMVTYPIAYVAKYRAHALPHNIFTSYYLLLSTVLLTLLAGRYLANLKDRKAILVTASAFIMLAGFLGQFHIAGGPPFAEFAAEQTSEYRAQLAESRALGLEFGELNRIFSGYYSLIPRNTGPVLVNWEIYDLLQNSTNNIDLELVENRNYAGYRTYPADYGVGLVNLNVSSARYFDLEPEDISLARDIESGRYEMIMVGPELWDSQIAYALRNVSNSTRDRYCTVYLPAIDTRKNIRHRSQIWLNDTNKCNRLLVDAVSYSMKIFNWTCRRDEWAANNLISNIMAYNRIRFEGQREFKPVELGVYCRSNVNLFDRINESQTKNRVPGKIQVALCLLAAAIPFLFYFKGGFSGKAPS